MKTVIISIDAELAWGFQNLTQEQIPADQWSQARSSWKYLLSRLNKYNIPATWAVVGHLFLPSCNGKHKRHPAGDEWFKRDPGGKGYTNWLGQDLIRDITNSDIEHEIALHSYSHVDFQETSEKVAEAEVQFAVEAANEYGVEPKTFIYPKNNIQYRNILAEKDIICYRGISPDRWYDNKMYRPLGKLCAYTLLQSPPPIVKPQKDEYGLINIPASIYLFGFEGIGNKLTSHFCDPVVNQVKTGLEQLQDRNEGILHLWLHPNNITAKSDKSRLNSILQLVSQYQKRYGYEIRTMDEIAQGPL